MADVTVSSFFSAAVAWGTAPLALRPVFYAAAVAWSTAPLEVAAVWQPEEADAESVAIIVLARAEEFVFNGAAPTHWRPARNGHFGTYHATRELGWGTVLSMTRARRAPTGTETDAIGLNLAGTVGDEVETVTVHCDVSLLDPGDVPQTGDLFALAGKQYVIFQIEEQSELDADKEMTVTGIHWRGCNTQSTPSGFSPPASWA